MIRSGEALYYYHNDHLGTPQILTDETGTVSWKAIYSPFGEADISIGTVENPLRFPGQYYDQETGLHYNWNRYYDPKTGRYLSPDPIGLEGGINLFIYVANNPINFTDPLGLISKKDCLKDCHNTYIACNALALAGYTACNAVVQGVCALICKRLLVPPVVAACMRECIAAGRVLCAIGYAKVLSICGDNYGKCKQRCKEECE
jgi:RHS repeat-associated protein